MATGPGPSVAGAASSIAGYDCTYPAKDGLAIGAYLARPDGPGPFPAVVVLHARNGLLPFFKECADELAREGFVGFSIGWQTRLPPNEDRRMPSDQDVMDDVAAGIEYLRAQPFADVTRLGIMGFCAGGTYTYLALSVLDAFRSGVPHYGATRRFREGQSPAAGQLPTAYDLADKVRASIHIIQGEQDQAVPLQDVYDYRDRLKSLGKNVDVTVYPGMGHAFTIRGGRSYDEANATDAWNRTVAHFKRTLIEPAGLADLEGKSSSHAPPAAGPARWEFDPHHSLIEFRARHLGLALLQGTFSRASVTFDLNEEDITRSSFEAVIDAASVDVHYERATEVFQSEAHLEVARYPTIEFKSRRITPHDGHYLVSGDLTLHGVTREITWDSTYNGEAVDHFGRTRRGFSLTTDINLPDFGVPSGGRPGVPGDEHVRVNLEIEILKQGTGEPRPPRAREQASAS